MPKRKEAYYPDARRPKIRQGPGCVVAVDPGAAHVGVALWDGANGTVHAKEVDAEDWLPLFGLICPRVDLVIVEKFVLYPGSAKSLSWSPMDTSEMIGAMKWIAKINGVAVRMQGADIKIPTRRQCKARGIQWRHPSGHASDACLHLQHYLIRKEES